jgi:nicotinamidase-related amidase
VDTIHLPVRYYRALPIDRPGLEYECMALPVKKTALIGMHCWNIGCPDGPPVDMNFCVGMGWPQAAEESYRIMVEVIRPAMDAARPIGLAVCHVESDWMDKKYPEITSRRNHDAIPEYSKEQQQQLDQAHGPNYLTDSPLAQMQRAEIVTPQADEPLIFYTDVLDEYLKARQIDTLIYTGFAADMCILGAEGGARPMLSRGYRCILMRDATVGVETPESFPDRLATRYATHLFEWNVGYSTTFHEFINAIDSLTH